jgi:hypothetical protein
MASYAANSRGNVIITDSANVITIMNAQIGDLSEATSISTSERFGRQRSARFTVGRHL